MTIKEDCKLRKNFWSETGLIVLLLVLTLLFFWQIITPRQADRAVVKGDFGPLFYPYRLFAARSLGAGEIPLWNPYDYGGMPFLADPQSAVFYPPNLLLTFFLVNGSLPILALEFQLLLHIFLAGLFTYLFARTIGLKRFPAFVSGITFMFAGFMAAHMEHLVIINAVTWLPLILLFLEKGLREGKLRWSVPAGWAFGFTVLAGHYQMALYVALAAFFYLVFRLFWAFRDGERAQAVLRKSLLFPLVVAVGLGISAVQVIPALEIIGRSYRSGVDYQFTTTFSFPLYHLITLLIPNFFGGNPGHYWGFYGPGNFWEFCGYVGILPLFLAGLGTFFRRNRQTVLFASLALFSFLLLLGGETFLHTVMYLLIPGFNRNRAPARFSFLFAFAISILAGYGASFLASKLENQEEEALRKFLRWALTVSVIALAGGLVFYFGLAESVDTSRSEVFVNIVKGYNLFLILLFLSLGLLFLRIGGRIRIPLIQVLVASLILFDLLTFGPPTFADKEWDKIFLVKHPVVDFLKRDKMKFRILNVDAFVSDIFKIENIRGPLIPVVLQKVKDTLYPPSLMNTRYAVAGQDLLRQDVRDVDGVKIDVGQNFLADGRRVSIPEVETTAIVLISNLVESVDVGQQEKVGEVEIVTTEGEKLAVPVLAGKDTAQYDYQEPAITRSIKHDKPRIAYEYDESGKRVFTYISRKHFDSALIIRSLRFLSGSQGLKWRVFGATLLNKETGNQFAVSFAGDMQEVFKHGDLRVYRYSSFLPRAFVVDGYRVVPREEEMRAKVLEAGFDPRRVLLLARPVSGMKPSTPKSPSSSRARIVSYHANRMELKVDMRKKGFLFLSEIYYPGWKAFVDGKPTKIYQANYTFRALFLKPGIHTVKLVFDPWTFKAGLIVSAATLILGGILFGLSFVLSSRDRARFLVQT